MAVNNALMTLARPHRWLGGAPPAERAPGFARHDCTDWCVGYAVVIEFAGSGETSNAARHRGTRHYLKWVVASAGAGVKICPVRLPGFLLFLIAAFAMLAGCSSTGYSIAELAPEINGTLNRDKLIVAVGDTISVMFPFKKEWDHESRVRSDGSASFSLIDDVQVVGLSLTDLDTRLTQLYREKRSGQDALELTVDVPNRGGIGTAASSSGAVVFVVGEVENPGPVAISGRAHTLIEAIGAAGGHKKATANLRNTILVRMLTGTGEMRSWRLDADIYSWGSLPPIFLQDRDLIFVPNTAIDGLDIWVDKYIRQMLPFPYLSAPL